ncbi:MAG: hypothetical protein M0P09_05480 [Acholeplasmataceae bacterium]|nr:hypothetical protein [Acholeplasmataceae bacterium]
MPYQTFKDEAHRIPFSFNPRLDYLKVVKEVYHQTLK